MDDAGGTHEDDQFGTFERDQEFGIFRTDAVWVDSEVELVLEAANAVDCSAALAVATDLWDDQDSWNERIQQFAVQELLDLKNDTWLEDDEQDVSAAEFMRRMEPNTVAVFPDGSFQFWHGDGGLFGRHTILVSGTLSEGMTDAHIAG